MGRMIISSYPSFPSCKIYFKHKGNADLRLRDFSQIDTGNIQNLTRAMMGDGKDQKIRINKIGRMINREL